MDIKSPLVKLAIASALTFAVMKYVSNPVVKAAAAGVLGVLVAKRIPYVADALA